MNKQPPVVAILGPTAVGKTELSLELAERLNGEIISTDSRLLYRGMDIGTAKPSLEQRERVPHHLIDVANPDVNWSLVKFRTEALLAMQEIHKRKRLPLLVGGTGQYMTAILEGWIPPPKPADLNYRKELAKFAENQGKEALHEKLKEVDPKTAERIHASNVRRVIRALEIHHITGEPPSKIRRKEPPPFRSLRIGLQLPRDQLYERIDARIDGMILAGLLSEVQKLMDDGYGPELPAMSAIGYKQVAEVIHGKRTLEEAIAEMRRLTHQFVRRQANWFKPSDPEIHWFDVREGVVEEIVLLVRSWLMEE
ncbi:MAG: tRNA (adenosine(37)-N6)-dimethylallyltransferase MiaA [Chloroflexi bacterium RBG_16_48_8]|nr:MAG: tRNA (adenosine(37)-N6)-dimethylallyltransferase MiaA [Chloroflexi bacterium RBG_16_48_8]